LIIITNHTHTHKIQMNTITKKTPKDINILYKDKHKRFKKKQMVLNDGQK